MKRSSLAVWVSDRMAGFISLVWLLKSGLSLNRTVDNRHRPYIGRSLYFAPFWQTKRLFYLKLLQNVIRVCNYLLKM
jgi:hypothetical protein